MDWGMRNEETISPHIIFKMLKLSIIHYRVLSLAICTSLQSIQKGWTSCPKVRWLLTGMVDDGGVFECLSFNVERRGVENKYSGMLAWEEGISYLWDKLEDTFTRCKKIFKQAWYYFTHLFVSLRGKEIDQRWAKRILSQQQRCIVPSWVRSAPL